MGAKTNAYELCIGNPEGVGIDGRIQYIKLKTKLRGL
jgi:hypothetical protein